VIIELAHWSAIVPLAILALFRRGAPAAYWLVALGFACSFVADSVASLTAGSWSLSPYYLAAQFGLFAVAFFFDGARQMVSPVVVYVAVGSFFYLGMMQHREGPAPYTAFMSWWLPYQGVRLASFGLFVRAAWRTA
jgi:hypothetical protein